MASPSTDITVSSAFMQRLPHVIPTLSACEGEGSVWTGGTMPQVSYPPPTPFPRYARNDIFVSALAVILITGCAAGPARVPASTPQPQPPYGFTVEEEARILRLEDRREYDA